MRGSSRKHFFVWLLWMLPWLVHGQVDPPVEDEEEAAPTFADTEIRTAPLRLSKADEEYIIEIVIHRWGSAEENEQQTFALNVESQPDFIENARLEQTTISFGSDDWEKPLNLSFQARKVDEPEAEILEGELVLMIIPDDSSLRPEERRFVIPIRYRPEGKQSDKSILVTTVREDFEGTVSLDETHLECHTEEIPLYTNEPFWIFFKGFPEDKIFYYKLIGPDGEEIETHPYFPGRDYGNGILVSGEGAIASMYRAFDDYNIVDGNSEPRMAGVYQVMAAYYRPTDDDALGLGETLGEFEEIGTFELLPPEFHFKGIITSPELITDYLSKKNIRLTTVGSGKSATVRADWIRKRGEENLPQSATLDLNFNFPDSFIWTQDKLKIPVSITASGNTSGQESERYKTEIYLSSQNGFVVVPDAVEMTARNSNGSLKHRRGYDIISDSEGANYRREYGTYDFNFRYPGMIEPRGVPKKTGGWHVRNPDTVWALVYHINLREQTGTNATTYVWALFGAEPGEYSGPMPDGSTIGELTEIEDEPTEEDPEDEQADATGESTDPEGIAGASGTSPVGGGGSGGTSTGVSPSSGSSATGGADPIPTRSQGGTPGQDSQLEDALSTDNPDLVPPSHPRVAGFIAAWIGQAEPTANIDPDVNLRFNEWGNVVGQAKGGFITQNFKPDEAGGLSSPEYLWGFRRGLDSLGHCQLGEWVMAQLLGETLTGCSGRFSQTGPIPVPDVVGQFLDEAEQAIAAAGLVPVIEIGSPAPRSEDEGHVSGQDPPLGSSIKSGDTVAIEIFTNYTGSVSVPDLAGLTIDEAERALSDLGFSTQFQLGDPAPSSNLEDRIQKQDPTADSSLEASGTVTLWVYAPYIPVIVPNLVGVQVNEAELIALERGLLLRSLKGPTAPSRELAFTVVSQSPASGAELDPLEEIEVVVYEQPISQPERPIAPVNESNEPPAPERSDRPDPIQARPSPTQPTARLPSETEFQGDTITVPASIFGVALWTAALPEGEGLGNQLREASNRRPANGWAYSDDEGNRIHAVTAMYGKSGEPNSIAFGMYWEESGDTRSDEIQCGAPYQSEYFFDDENWTMGRMNSASRRAAVFFIGPTPKAAGCRAQLQGLLSQIERFARPCP